MNEIIRAVELTKARMLELDVAAIRIICHKAVSHEELTSEMLKLAASMEEQCNEIRVEVAKHDHSRN